MPNNVLTKVNLRIAMEIELNLKAINPNFEGSLSDKTLQIAIAAGVNIAIAGFRNALEFNIQETLIKAYLRKNVIGYK